MAQVIENRESRVISATNKSTTATYKYNMIGYADEEAALAAMSAFAPTVVVHAGLPCHISTVSYLGVSTGGDVAQRIYSGSIIYKTSDIAKRDEEPTQEGAENEIVTSDFSFREEEVSVAMAQTNVYWTVKDGQRGWVEFAEVAEGDGTRQLNNSSNWAKRHINQASKEDVVEGTVRNVPSNTFNIKRVFNAGTVTNAWFADRMNQCWTLNEYTFRDLAPRTVMFTGMQSSQRADDSWAITYQFEYRPFTQNFQILREDIIFKSVNRKSPLYSGSGRNSPKGMNFCSWDYMWVHTTEKEIVVNANGDKDFRAELQGFSVAKIYENSNFSLLGV